MKSLQETENHPSFHEREVWSASVGMNIGFEQDGKGGDYSRPILVIKKFNNDICWSLPLTKNLKEGKHYFPFQMNGDMSNAILSQLRLIDARRLRYKIGDISRHDFKGIKEKLRQFLV